MPVRSSDQIRQDFFDFFEKKNHLIVESAPVVPEDDPTLLFINAGMNPFKPIFLGDEEGYAHAGKVWKRVANTQKCIRVSGKHNDLEEVGHDTYHHTLFEMLGNWSFGDYFKKEAIGWAWELLVEHWGLDPDRLYATVFEGNEEDGLPEDQEAAELWASETGIPKSHILKFGKKDNFWEMGDTGPCGPCSEVHIDLRSDEERKKKDGAELVNMDDPRVMEIWNLVFIQFNRKQDGSLHSLPAQHVDTGMGFERIVAVLQNKTSNYDTDVFMPLINAIGKRAGIAYGAGEETDIAMRVIADHIRAVVFSITDGAAPGNEDRGYVIRRILRRASRYAWDRLGIKEAFMHEIVDVLTDQLKHVFSNLDSRKEMVKKVVKAEENAFLRTLDQGITYFRQMSEGKTRLSGEDAFKLHDTYGFPVDLTELMARENGLTVDLKRFDELMKEQKERARSAGKFKAGTEAGSEKGQAIFTLERGNGSVFTGYDETETPCQILETGLVDGKPAVILDKTPFYVESGGQISDIGALFKPDNGRSYRVLDVVSMEGHRVHLLDKTPDETEGTWVARVDAGRRDEIERHHSATHLLHAALREVLGDHVAQKGSLVAPDRLRFDFSHFEPVSPEQLDEIEERVNQCIRRNIPLQEERNIPIEEAKKRGAMMLFGEKYGDHVRVVTFDPEYSVELCGGTHVSSTGDIGYFRFINESSVAAGIRRVEAVTGETADRLLRNEKKALKAVMQQLGASSHPEKEIARLMDEKKQLEKEIAAFRKMEAGMKLQELLSQPEKTASGVHLIAGEVDGADMGTLKQMGYDAIDKAGENTVVVLGARDAEKGKVFLMAAVTEDLIKNGIKAGQLVGTLAKTVGGGGGGQPNLATAGGKQPEKLPEVFVQAKELLG
ncbi:alanine--tRNA ligase [Balneolaceae bacterium ANBcel3]|nr:alanine--tRNA ligase [Balneolaceae bacterium ANBcel3]